MVSTGKFGEYKEYTITSGDISLVVFELGATARSIKFRGEEMLLNYATAKEYEDGNVYLAAAVGRFANRIGGAKFTLNGREYKLSVNEKGNQLHGGNDGKGWHKRVWSGEAVGENAVKFTLSSPNGDNGFPGSMTASVTYSVEDSGVKLVFEGECDEDTVFAPTSHMYFNLDGRDDMLTSQMSINSSKWVEVDNELIPTGKIIDAQGDFDLREMRTVGRNFDHAFILDGEKCCSLRCGENQMDIYTDFPAVQLYTGEFLPAELGTNKAFAIEPEFYPDSPNKPQFPSVVLKKGEKFSKYALYTFKKV